MNPERAKREKVKKHSPATPVIIFDLGGVLIDWNPRYLFSKLFRGRTAEMEYFLTEICSPAWNAQMDAGQPIAEAVQERAREFPSYAELIRAYGSRWEEMIAGEIRENVQILNELRHTGHGLHALSNWSAETFPATRRRFPFLEWFETIVISGEVKVAKPDARIYQHLLARIGCQAQDCLFIDDSRENVVAASRQGFQTIQMQSAEQLRTVLQRRGLLPAIK